MYGRQAIRVKEKASIKDQCVVGCVSLYPPYGYYQEDDMWVGWLEEYPDYRSQGETLDELKGNLKDIYNNINAVMWSDEN